MMRKNLLIPLLVLFFLTLAAADCGCGTKCFAYSDPSRCTRCCTATVKRSLRHGPDGEPLSFDSKQSFLIPSKNSYPYPKWARRATDDRFLRKLSDILGVMTGPFL